MNNFKMNAFVPAATPVFAAQTRARVACPARPAAAAPFFASAAFGAPVPSRVSAPVGKAPTRMEVTVVVGDSEPVESALRRFKKDVLKSGHLFELRRRRYFETNTEKRLRKAAAARRKVRMIRNDNRKASQSGGGIRPGSRSNNNNSSSSSSSSSGTGPRPSPTPITGGS